MKDLVRKFSKRSVWVLEASDETPYKAKGVYCLT